MPQEHGVNSSIKYLFNGCRANSFTLIYCVHDSNHARGSSNAIARANEHDEEQHCFGNTRHFPSQACELCAFFGVCFQFTLVTLTARQHGKQRTRHWRISVKRWDNARPIVEVFCAPGSNMNIVFGWRVRTSMSILTASRPWRVACSLAGAKAGYAIHCCTNLTGRFLALSFARC